MYSGSILTLKDVFEPSIASVGNVYKIHFKKKIAPETDKHFKDKGKYVQ